MFELFGQRGMPSNVISLSIRLVYMFILVSGWAAYAFTILAPVEQEYPFLWGTAIFALAGLPAFVISGRIEQYWLHAVWGLGFAKAWKYFMDQYPEAKDKWHETLNDPKLSEKV